MPHDRLTMPRYVILYHELPASSARASHYDLMLEAAGALRTWALPTPPSTGEQLPVEQLPDHRIAYLDYEGPVSRGRGTVTRWDQGTYTTLVDNPSRLEVQLEGERLRGKLIIAIRQRSETGYCIEFVSADESTGTATMATGPSNIPDR